MIARHVVNCAPWLEPWVVLNDPEHQEMPPMSAAGPLPSVKYPLYALTTSELSAYRLELEHEIGEHAPTAAVVDTLRGLLADVLDEEEDRARLRRAI
jgi:hypothetical protein